MINRLKIINIDRPYRDLYLKIRENQTCFIENLPELTGKILERSNRHLKIRWDKNNTVRYYSHVTSNHITSHFDEFDLRKYINLSKEIKYKNKLECICLLISDHEVYTERYNKFLENLFIQTKEEGKKFQFNIVINKTASVIPKPHIEQLKQKFKGVDVYNLNLLPHEDVYTTNPEELQNILGTIKPELGFVSGPNICFFEAIKHHSNFNTTLFLEIDSIVTPNWLNRIDKFTTRNEGSFWVSGPYYDGVNYRIKKRHHINGGTALYATGENTLQLLMKAVREYIKYRVENGKLVYTYDFGIRDFIDDQFNYVSEIGDIEGVRLWNYIDRQYLKNNLIYNLSTKYDEHEDLDKFYKLYDFAILHTKNYNWNPVNKNNPEKKSNVNPQQPHVKPQHIKKKDIPVFFHVPKNSGTYVLTMAIKFFRVCKESSKRFKYINVCDDGVIKYRLLVLAEKNEGNTVLPVSLNNLDLTNREVLFIIVSPHGFKDYKEKLYPSLENYKLKEFICLREPYSRTQSIFNYLSSDQSSHEPTHKYMKTKTISDFIQSNELEGNWLFYNLLNLDSGEIIGEEHYKELCVVLNDMMVFDCKRVDECMNAMLGDDYKNIFINQILTKNNTHKPVHQTIYKEKKDFNDLSEHTQQIFLEKCKWDLKIYNKYTQC
jgi:hypothetical protein